MRKLAPIVGMHSFLLAPTLIILARNWHIDTSCLTMQMQNSFTIQGKKIMNSAIANGTSVGFMGKNFGGISMTRFIRRALPPLQPWHPSLVSVLCDLQWGKRGWMKDIYTLHVNEKSFVIVLYLTRRRRGMQRLEMPINGMARKGDWKKVDPGLYFNFHGFRMPRSDETGSYIVMKDISQHSSMGNYIHFRQKRLYRTFNNSFQMKR